MQTSGVARVPAIGKPDSLSNLGSIIAAYRRRRRQPYRDLPWSQEELAFTSNTDQAHISRIESNRQHPEYSTLSRICDALELSQTERAYVLAMAGYRVGPPLPDDASVSSALAKLAPLLDSYPYPASLIDESERMWHLNPLAVRLWGACYGSTDQQACLELVRGRRTVEIIFDSDRSNDRLPCWASYYDDIDRVLMRVVALFWRAYRIHTYDVDLNRVALRLADNPACRGYLDRVENGEDVLQFIEHTTYTITHPDYGRLRLHSWRTRAAVDERFVVTHFSPVDSETSRVLERLADTRRHPTPSASVRFLT
jgi:transcriptional regulator with XRE-family HTH domain